MPDAPTTAEVEMLTTGLWVQGPAPAVREFHRQDDLGLNVVLDGTLDYRLGEDGRG